MNSLKVGILIASTTEGQVERKLKLVLILRRSTGDIINKIKAINKGGIKGLDEHRLRIIAFTYFQRRAVQSTLLNVCSDNGGRILILSKGSASSLVGRAITTKVGE